MSVDLSSPEMERLLSLVEESARSTEESVKHFVEPAPGTLQRATIKRHHIVFGRRGSGKSSLLHKAAADLTVDRRPIAYVNLEAFKGHHYPDVLLSVLIKSFSEFKEWMDTAAIHPATKTSYWSSLFGTSPSKAAYPKRKVKVLSEKLDQFVSTMKAELTRKDDAELVVTSSDQDTVSTEAEVKGGVGNKFAKITSKLGSKSTKSQSTGVEEKFARAKVDFLHHHILDYQKLFEEMAELSGGDSFLFLDDLYHIRRSDQANVIDYFHRIAKDHNLWLKVGTIRHRTRWYVQGDPPVGMKIGDDADEIDLDLTLEKYSLAKEFLVKILTNFSTETEVGPIASFLTSGARDRLVLASGGVARDFLSIFRRSISIARERGGGYRGGKVGAEDVNVAAGENDSSKREEFNRDTSEDNNDLESEFQKIQVFCLSNNTNCFLVQKDLRGDSVDRIHELVDLKFIHLARSRVTVRTSPGVIFEAYMLDISQYTGSRKRRDLKIVEFWKDSSSDALRQKSLIYSPVD